jgi:PKD repeat protein
MTRTLSSFLLAFLVASALAISPVHAQNVNNGLYGKLGVGFSDYTGDFPIQNTGYPVDLQEFVRVSDGTAEGFPVMFDGELGYQFSPKWGLAVGFQGGSYPIAGYAGSVDDTWRYTPHLLGRYTFGTPGESISFYLDAGINATFGGDSDITSIGYGPSVGGGVDIPVSDGLSFYIESRFHGTLPDDAVDGTEGIEDRPPGSTNTTNNPSGSFLNGIDSINQLLGFGLKFSLTTPVPPRVIALDGPTSAQTGEEVTFTATVNEDEANRPLSYQWQFGDGNTGSGLTASHRYNQSGSYTVTFTASNNVDETSESLTVEVTPAPEPIEITLINADPNPVDEGEPVRFSSNVTGTSPISRDWSFGDGSSATGESPTHTYDEPGEYTARLQASNEAGEDSRTVTVRVNRVLPEICTTVSELNSSFFESNSSTLTDEAERSLQENADILSKCPNLRVAVEGFAAPGERNPQSLSEDRAEAVADFYENNGVSSDRIETSAQGEVEGVTTKKGGTRQYRRVDSIPEEMEGGM